MKLKHFIFVFLAMLSFAFSGFAQTTVKNEAELRAVLESTQSGSVVLGNNIELSAQVTIPKKTTHTLDLNGKKITGGLYVYGTLTINDTEGTGELTASTYVLNGAGGSKIILNGGRVYRGSSWSVYTTGIFVVNGGEVANTIRVAGSGSIQLNGGTVTAVQVTSGNLNITGDAVVEGNLNIEKGAKSVNIADGTINGDITIATEATDKVEVSGGTFKDADAIKDYLPGGSALLQKPDGTYEIVAGLLKIGNEYYPTLDAAFKAAKNGDTIELINQEGSVIAMNGSLYGKSVTITGTAKVDWSKGFLFVGRGGEGNATLTFDNANLTSTSNSASYGIHVSGREKGTADKYDGTLVVKNSTIGLDYLINKGAMTLDNSSLTVKNGFDLNGRPASETENGEDANATLALTNNSKLVVNNHNGMGIGREGKGELTVDASSTFEHTQDFLVCAKGTMDVKGTLVSNGKKLTNNGEVKFTATKLTAATIEGSGTTRFYNDVNFYGANSITTTGINGTPFHLVINEGANLFITRFVLGYDRNITVNGTIADASAFNPEGQTPSLKFNSTSGVSVGGTGTGNLTVNNAYVELGNSSWKNAQGTYDWDFVNSYVSAVSFTNATGADAATWDVTFDKSILDAKNYIKNGKNVTYNFTNKSRGTTGSLRIDGVLNIDATSSVVTTSQQNNKVGAVDEHGGINGTVNVAGNLTIGSNAKTQLEVLGGTINVVDGATLALGNNTMTLDATSALQSAGNISGAITAADGANVAISGGTYTQDVSNWCADGFMTQQNADGSFGIAKAAAKIGDKKYSSLEEAFKAATSGCTIDILSDVTVDYNWDARYTGGKFTVPVTINGNGKTIKFTASVNDNNYQAPFRFEADATVKNLTIDMSEVTDNRFRAISSKGNLTVDGCKFIGKDESLNCRAIIFGEGAGANVGNLAIAITNSEFINWKRGITDNENAQDVKTVTITGNTLTDAGVGVSAKETVTFTGNTVAGAYVNIKSYTAGNKLAVTATGNTLEANTDAAYNVIDAGGVVNAEGFNVVAKGNNFNGYTGTDGIWGEVWGNARESFVIKVLDANGNVMGTTSLNNIGGIINGNVNVSWNLKFNAAANTDEYWTMVWTTAPTLKNMPANVELWVDGTRVSGGPVVLNGPDDLNKIVAAVTDADGKILSCQTSVANAAATNATNIALLRNTTEEIILPAGVKLNTNGFTAANVKTAVAVIGTQKFASLQDAIDAVKDGETIALTDNVTGNVTLTEKVALHYTIDGAGKQFKGSISVNSLSDTNDNRRITIKNIQFVDDSAAKVDFISSVATNHYPRLTVEGCTFTGNGDATDVAVRLKSSHSVVIKDCTGTGLHSFIQNTSGWNLTIEGVTVTNSKGAFALGTVQGVTIKGSTIDVATYGIRLDANTYNNNAVIEGNEVTAFIPVVVRNVNTQSNVTFTGENTFTAENTDGKWMVIGTTEYEEGVALPAEVATGNVVVALNGTNLSYEGVHGAGLAGKGTAEAPYLINNVTELEIFRNSVNAGSTKYSKPGLCVALNADIDMTGVNWVGIGTATADHGFMGNFDGKTFKIKNLTITNPALDSDGYAYAGLFGVTEGTDKDNQNVIKNLTIENVTINTTGDIVSAAIAYPYYTIVENVKVCGNIAITGGNYTAGVLAYTRRCVNASNLSIDGNEGSFVKGNQTVGGVISDIQMNGGLTAVYSNFSAEGIKVTGEKSVGGIAGIIATQTLNGATVKNVTLDSTDEFAGVVAGRLGGTSTISKVVAENVTGATAVIGATFDGAKAIEARIGDTYYSTFAAAYTAAKAGETVTMLADLNMSEILVLDKAITLDGNGKKLTSTAGRAINVDCEGNVGIKNLTINASGERAINVIQKPANVTIDKVTATAANYTVNLASSAGAAKVAISNSNLTGLNVVNVAAPGSEITINGGTITCNDQNANENYAALTMNKDAVGAKIAATGVTFDIKGDSKKASNQAEGGTITIDGSTDEVEQHVAYISYGNNWYGFATLEAAIAKANAGETVTLLRDINASAIITIDKTITLDGNGKTLTSTAGRAINVETEGEVTISNLTINAAERAINIINKPATVTLNAVTATANNNAVMIATSAGAAKVTINGCNFTGLAVVNVAGANAEVAIKDTKITNVDNTDKENYGAITVYSTATNANVTVEGGSITVGDDSKKAYIFAEGATVTGVDQVGQIVAMIGDAGYETLEEAISGAKAGQTVKLVCDITVANPVTIAKSITLDGANKTLTYTGTNRAIEMPNVADANYDVTIKNLNVVATTANRGLNYNDNGKLNVEGVTVTIGENVDGYAINFPGMADNAQVTIKDSKLTSRNPLNIWGENMTINVHNSELISVDNSTTYDYAAIQLNNDNYGNVANGTTVNVYGGSITAFNEKGEPSNVVANATETGVVNISDETVITGKVLNYVANIGGAYFGSLQAAVNAIEKQGYNSPIVIMKDFATSEATTIKSGLKVTINLNGKTITGTDNETKSYGLININPGAELTISDATGNGAIKLTATNNREWNAYSSVISNQRGKLTVNGGTIEHLGGTDMAYAIDNLTNGKGTKAETIINGGTVKSTYRAIRQFLNGTEADNILTVNGGTIEGTNKSIWMQDPSKNANTGNLTVGANAKLNGDVYLFVTAGSTEWPVNVSINASALQDESKVVTGNVPAGYDVAEVNGAYGVYTGVAKIGTAYYETLKAAVAAAQAGETITLIDNVEATEVILLDKSLTINGNGYKVTSNATRVFRATTSNTEITLNDVNMVNTAVRVGTNDIRGISVDDVQNVKLTLNNCSVDFTDASANDWTYAVNVVGGSGHVVSVNGGTYEGANVINVRGANQKVTVKDAVLTSLYPNNDTYYGACIYVVQNANSSVEATGNTFNGDNAFAFNVGYTPVTESNNTDNTKYVVAKIGDTYYTSIQDAIEAAQDGETVRLIQNVTMTTAERVLQNDGYAVLVNAKDKKVAIDLNGKKITVNAAAADLAGAKGKMLLAVFHADTKGELILTNNTEAKAGAVVVNVNDATVYSVFASESQYSDKSESGKITVNGGNYTTVGKVSNAMFFTDANEVITVNGGNFHCDGASTTASNPWMFNTLGNNERHVTVNGGTFNVDINHQHRPFEVKVPETHYTVANADGTYTIMEGAVAYITEMLGGTVNEAGEWGHEVGYATIAEAIAAVNELGNKVSIVKNVELKETLVVPADKTVVLDLNGKTVSQEKACTASYEMIKNLGNLTITDGTEAKAGKLSFKDTSVGDPNFGWGSYTVRNEGTLVVENGTIEHLGTQSFATHCIMAVFQYSGSTTINGGTISTPNYRSVRLWKGDMTINGGTFDGQVWVQATDNTAKLTINGGTFEPNGNDASSVFVTNNQYDVQFAVTNGTFNGKVGCSDVTKLTEAISGGTFSETAKNGTKDELLKDGFIWSNVLADGTYNVVVDPAFGNVAKIGNGSVFENQYFATINEAVQAAQSGETVTLIADVETSAEGYATVGEENYAVIVAVKEKDITLDLNGKSVTVTPTTEELANAEGKMLMSVFGMDTNGKLTLTGNGSVKVNANGANVYSLVAAYGEGSAVVIENGNYEVDAVMSSGSLIYSHEMITVMGGTFNLGNLATGANGSPWIFNTIGQNYTGVKVVGGTYPTDINHQFWANEVLVPEAYALQNNGNGTWTVVDAVAYTNEKATSRNASWRHVGYASLEDAIAATGKYNCQNNTVTMIKDITLEPLTVANGVKVAIDLNGKTISGTDNGTASYGLITNKGDLTINGTGTIKLTATQDRGWNAFSSVISNQVGGKLTVNGGTIQHLGGTSMAYAIDNLTNGKGTYAETIINGGEIKSTYRPIRMFLNGVEADNILTVNAGTIEGTGGNKAAIWMQTAGDVAHSGTLYVGENAVIKNNVYLDADNLMNVREYPVEAYIAKAALAEGMTVLADNIPAEAAALVEYDTFWQVEQKNLAKLTIEDACAEYINKIEKNVGVLTYERYFDDTEWQTIVLPFDVPVANLTDQFEVAYIYNASYKGKQATIDYVEVTDPEFVLAANYPYMIKAKATGWNNIVVENAKLMPTKVEILDCSSIFEVFSFIGNYATVKTETLDAKYGYFNLTSGAWSKMDVVNPFRFYMQIKLRNGAAFEYLNSTEQVRMRQVNANGGTTGIGSVGADQNVEFIFDLNGRRVAEPQKGGIYIVNGKKILF